MAEPYEKSPYALPEPITRAEYLGTLPEPITRAEYLGTLPEPITRAEYLGEAPAQVPAEQPNKDELAEFLNMLDVPAPEPPEPMQAAPAPLAPSVPEERVSPSPGPDSEAEGDEPGVWTQMVPMLRMRQQYLEAQERVEPPPMRVTFDSAEEGVPGITLEPVFFESPKDVQSETMLLLSTGVEGEGRGLQMGERALDLNATAQKLARERTALALQKRASYTASEAKSIAASEFTKAKREVSDWYTKASQSGEITAPLAEVKMPLSLMGLQLDPGGENIRHWANSDALTDPNSLFLKFAEMLPEGEFRKIVAPFVGSWAGAEVSAQTPMGRRTYNEGLNWGGLDWAGRQSLLTMVSNYLVVPGGQDWGGEEMMRNLARGEELFTLFDRAEAKFGDPEAGYLQAGFGAFLSGLSGAAEATTIIPRNVFEGLTGIDMTSDEASEAIGDFIAAAGLTFVDPDIWMGVGGSVAKLSKKGIGAAVKGIEGLTGQSLGLINHATSMKTTENVIRENMEEIQRLLTMPENVAFTREQLQEAVEISLKDIEKRAGPGAAAMIKALYQADLGVNTSPSKAVLDAFDEANRSARARSVEWEKMDEAQSFFETLDEQTRRFVQSNPDRGLVDSTARNAERRLAEAIEARMSIESRYPNTKRAARAREAVDNALDVKGVADRQKKAVDDFDNLLAGADASPRSKAVLDFRVKADNFVLASAALSDLKNLRKTVAAIRPVIRGRAAPVPAKETEELAANLEQLMRKSLDPSVSDAERADVLVQFYTELGDVANNVGADVLGVLDDKIAQMEKSVKGAKKDYNRQRRYMKRRNFWEPEFDEATKMMKDTLAALEEASEQYAGNRGMASLFRVLSRTADAYKVAANPNNLVPPAIVQQADRFAMEFSHTDKSLRGSFNKARVWLRDTISPVIPRTGSTNADVQQVFLGAEINRNADFKYIVDSLSKRAREETDPAEFAKKAKEFVIDMLDDTTGEMGLIAGSYPESRWGAAKYYLRSEENIKELSNDDSILVQLSRMWLVGQELTKNVEKSEGGELIKSAKEYLNSKKNATFDQFQKHMLRETAKVVANREYALFISPLKKKIDDAEKVLESARRSDIEKEAASEAIKKAKAEINGKYRQVAGSIRAKAGHRGMTKAALAVTQAAAIERMGWNLSKIAADPDGNLTKLVNAWTGNEVAELGNYGEAMMDLMSRLGFSVNLQKTGQATGKQLAEGFAVYNVKNRGVDGREAAELILTGREDEVTTFVPRRWIDQMNKNMGEFANSLDAAEAAAEGGAYAGAGAQLASTYSRIWNQAILQGLFLPDPKYAVMIQFGNMSQIFLEEGLGYAAAAGTRFMSDITAAGVEHLPYVGKVLKAEYGEPPPNSLPSAVGSAINKTITAFFDTKYGTAQALIEIAGKKYTWAQLRAMAHDKGVVTSFVGTSGVKRVTRRLNAPKGVLKYADEFGQNADNILSFFQHIEERQRVGMWLHLMNEGVSAEEAAVRVKKALYDWQAPMSQIEETYLKKFFMFWSFQRRALGQQMNALLDPTFGYSNKMSRTSKIAQIQTGLTESVDQYLTDQEGVMPYDYPLWRSEATARTYFGKSRLPLEIRNARVLGTEGRPYDAYMYSAPAATSFGSMQLISDTLAVFKGMASGEPVQPALNLAGGMTGPVGREMVRGLQMAYGKDINNFGMELGEVGEKVRVAQLDKPTDKIVFGIYDMLSPGQGTYEYAGGVYTASSTYALYRAFLPVLSVDLAGFLDPAILTVAEQRDLGYLLRQLTGVVSETKFTARSYTAEEIEEGV